MNIDEQFTDNQDDFGGMLGMQIYLSKSVLFSGLLTFSFEQTDSTLGFGVTFY